MPQNELLLKSYAYSHPISLTYFQQEEEPANLHPDPNPHRHRYYELLFFKKAYNITHYVDFVSFKVLSGSLFFVSPRQIHFIQSDSSVSKYELYVITFSEAFLALVTAESDYKKVTADLFAIDTFLKLENNDSFFETFWHEISHEINAREPDHEKVAVNLFRNLLIYLKRQSGKRQVEEVIKIIPANLFVAFQRLIEEHCHQHWSVLQYANALHITTRQLHRLCTTLKGCSAQALIHEQINIEAKRNLHHTQLQIKEVASKLGFKDQAYFSRFFKRMNQESPESFRCRLVEKYK